MNEKLDAGGRYGTAAVWFLVCLWAGAAWADQTLTLGLERDHHLLSPHADILADDQGKWGIEQVSTPPLSSRFTPVRDRMLRLGFGRKVYWIRFNLSRKLPRPTDQAGERRWILDVGSPLLISAGLYSPNLRKAGGDGAGPWLLSQTGAPPHISEGAESRRHFVFRLSVPWGREATYYLRLDANSPIMLPLAVSTEEHYLYRSIEYSWFLGVFYGLLAALIIYNFFIFLSLGDRTHLWYVLNLMAVSVFFLRRNGLLLHFFPDLDRDLLLRLHFVVLGAMVLSSTQLARSFLLAKNYSAWLDRLLLGLLGLGGGLFVLSFFAEFGFLINYGGVLGFVGPFTVIFCGAVAWRRGFRPAKFLLLAWVFWAVGTLGYALTIKGILPPLTWGTHHLFQISAGLEAILLSLALARRLRIMKEERASLEESQKRLKILSDTDGLTGLYNKRFFLDRLEQEVERARRLGATLSVIILDVDSFKRFNDTHGHPEGDKVLKKVAGALRESVRENDVVARFGGDEFVSLLPGTGLKAATAVAERIRLKLADQVFQPQVSGRVQVTLSLGLAELVPGEDAAGLIERADQALYRAKTAGRNQVVQAEPLAAG